MLRYLKIAAGVLGAVACLIPYLAGRESYTRSAAAVPQEGRVLSVEGDRVLYEVHAPGSQWNPDPDGDGWSGPYFSEGVPAALRANLSAGDTLVVRRGELELALSPPSPLFLVGFVLSLLLAFYWGIAPRFWRRSLEKFRNDPIALIKLFLRRSRRNNLIVALLMFAMGSFIIAVPFAVSDAEAGGGSHVFLVILGALAVLIGIRPLIAVFRLLSIDRAPLLKALKDSPRDIVWIYQTITTVNDIPTHQLGVHTADGKAFGFELGEIDAEPLVAALNVVVPHAVVGYSAQREQQWKKAPGGFLLSEDL